MPQSVPVIASVMTPLLPEDALRGILSPPSVPGRRFVKASDTEVLYEDDCDGVTTHLVVGESRDSAQGTLRGPFGTMSFELRLERSGDSTTSVNFHGSYEPQGLLLRMMARRSARILEAQLHEGIGDLLRHRERACSAPAPAQISAKAAGAA
ncbi:MAG: hypothetical protein ACYDDF_00245 [Thermoplasmatota archaeon]